MLSGVVQKLSLVSRRYVNLNENEQNFKIGGSYNVLLSKLYKNHHVYRDNKV